MIWKMIDVILAGIKNRYKNMLQAKKELGQNFLKDDKAITNMLTALEISDHDEIVEIGPGLGALTKRLMHQINETNKLFAIEFDPRFIYELQQITQGCQNVEVINANILDWLPKFEPQDQTGKNYKIVGSLPYYITSPILHKIIYAHVQPQICVLLIQKEVAEKISAQPDETSYLSSFIQAFYDVEYLQTVDKTQFRPVPKVDGGIIKLTKKAGGTDTTTDITKEKIHKFEGFLHKAYANPRKMLNKAFTEEELQRANISPNLRPQNISVDQWISFFNLTG
jgi:16S rRNA (adenine1518-N6/adenine1519-N6)-dimethyltransferase